MLFLKIIPLKIWIIGAVVILLGLAGYQTFIGDRMSKSEIVTASMTPFPSFESSPTSEPSPSVVPSSSVKVTPKPSVKASVAPSSAASPSPSVAASTSNTNNSSDMRINEVSPTSANFQQTFTLKGNNFGNSAGSVAFYNPQGQVSAGAPIESWSNTEIRAKVPFVKGGTDFQLEVSAGGKTSNRVTFRVNLGQPQNNGMSPSNPAPGGSVTFSGSELGSSNGSVTFYDGGTPAGNCNISSWNDTQIACTVPGSLSANKEYGVQITTSDGRQTSFKYYTLGS